MDLQCKFFHKIYHYTDYREGKEYSHTELCSRCEIEELAKLVGWDTLSWCYV